MTDDLEPFAPARRATPVPPRSVQFLTYESIATDRVDVLDVLRELTRRPAWMADALCREYADVSFFPERGNSAREAKAVCARCAVRRECADYAAGLDGIVVGIWGGESAAQVKRGRVSPAA